MVDVEAACDGPDAGIATRGSRNDGTGRCGFATLAVDMGITIGKVIALSPL
ncbi:hypothetical protein ACNKHM_04570 [Shigella sonnei]